MTHPITPDNPRLDKVLKRLLFSQAMQSGFRTDPVALRNAKAQIQALIDKAEIEARVDELFDLSKSFDDQNSYKGYMVKQVISARGKWVSKNGKVHIGIADLAQLTSTRKEVSDE